MLQWLPLLYGTLNIESYLRPRRHYQQLTWLWKGLSWSLWKWFISRCGYRNTPGTEDGHAVIFSTGIVERKQRKLEHAVKLSKYNSKKMGFMEAGGREGGRELLSFPSCAHEHFHWRTWGSNHGSHNPGPSHQFVLPLHLPTITMEGFLSSCSQQQRWFKCHCAMIWRPF